MQISVTMKSTSRKKDYLTKKRMVLETTPKSLQQLITEIITVNVKQFNEKEGEKPLVDFLTTSEILQQSTTGKVGFGTKYNENKTDLEEAINTAIQAFHDGLFKVFVNEREQESLEAPLQLEDGAEVVFIKLTMLTGRMW
ncbi:hypothetical protein H1D32_08535 [Anaerobacillus sp. CMMVII]|uniref:hypothetical protein n=1 Tax=Anaerobacillus sp. CMMVII TaxID=2755588 RepID=UPI0021B751DE|nr:hypothetical protein [Anaerobacillus sp. CMMVII]MCT8137798.1 hypothetical protein [Anaerobacillus sp. CMMVII]